MYRSPSRAGRFAGRPDRRGIAGCNSAKSQEPGDDRQSQAAALPPGRTSHASGERIGPGGEDAANVSSIRTRKKAPATAQLARRPRFWLGEPCYWGHRAGVGRLVHAQILLVACQRRIRLEPNPLDSRTGREAPGDPSSEPPTTSWSSSAFSSGAASRLNRQIRTARG